MSDQFIRQLIEHQGESARQIERRFAGVSDTIEVDFTQAELDLLNERIEAGGNLGRAAQDLLDDAIAKAEALEKDNPQEDLGNDPAQGDGNQSGDAGAKGASKLAKPVGEKFKDAALAGLKRSEQRT